MSDPVNPFYELIKQSCNDYRIEDKVESINDDSLYADYITPYKIIAEYLGLSEEEFDSLPEIDFEDEWTMLCEAEQMVLKEFEREIK